MKSALIGTGILALLMLASAPSAEAQERPPEKRAEKAVPEWVQRASDWLRMKMNERADVDQRPELLQEEILAIVKRLKSFSRMGFPGRMRDLPAAPLFFDPNEDVPRRNGIDKRK